MPTVSYGLHLIVNRFEVVANELYFAFDAQHILVDATHAFADLRHFSVDEKLD